ncbi:putative leucine-rich repeat receptor-like serine/threonine-protein kinase [Senna tora]|uniref:Putative leucine-rich repeat receptor-like serine/threonine-protein kinase n=1 Tax=Senna tora TaxID=362788 RepID=A0A834VYI5_9FABA|nr:putative leucine-rich repeat receptor-like serine/threonine-protein kinase [Senna tora]
MSRKLKGKSGSAAMVLQLQNHGSGSAAERRTMVLVLLNSSRNLSSRRLTGEIDASFSRQTKLESLDLSNNKLTRKIPEFFSELPSLKFLNLLGNQLTGSIPKSLKQKSNTTLVLSLEGNPGLCQTGNQQNHAMVLQQNQTMELVLQQNHGCCSRTISGSAEPRTKPWFCSRTRPWNWFCSRTMSGSAAEPFLMQQQQATSTKSLTSHGSAAEPSHGSAAEPEPWFCSRTKPWFCCRTSSMVWFLATHQKRYLHTHQKSDAYTKRDAAKELVRREEKTESVRRCEELHPVSALVRRRAEAVVRRGLDE